MFLGGFLLLTGTKTLIKVKYFNSLVLTLQYIKHFYLSTPLTLTLTCTLTQTHTHTHIHALINFQSSSI